MNPLAILAASLEFGRNNIGSGTNTGLLWRNPLDTLWITGIHFSYVTDGSAGNRVAAVQILDTDGSLRISEMISAATISTTSTTFRVSFNNNGKTALSSSTWVVDSLPWGFFIKPQEQLKIFAENAGSGDTIRDAIVSYIKL